MVHFKKYKPASRLEPYIQSYFLLEIGPNEQKGNHERLQNHSQGTFDLMFGLMGTLDMKNHKNDSFQLNNIFVIGHQEGYFGIQFEENTSFFGVVFYPESFSKLFNFPLTEIANRGRRLEGYLSSDYKIVQQRLQETTSNTERVAVLNTFFEAKLSQVDFSFSKFDQLIRKIRLNPEPMTIPQLQDLSNLSERSLQRKMKRILGVSPKSFSQVMRIKHVLAYIHDNPHRDWQDVLYLFGYYDQAHFIKDFKRYTGRTPESFVNGNSGLSGHFLKNT